VVQFGFAINFDFQIVHAFICGITKGTSFSYLKKEELSITIAQDFMAISAKSFDISHHAENKTKSNQEKKSLFTSFTKISQKGVFILFQADFKEAHNLRFLTGIFKL
jgi:hypothetical protein